MSLKWAILGGGSGHRLMPNKKGKGVKKGVIKRGGIFSEKWKNRYFKGVTKKDPFW